MLLCALALLHWSLFALNYQERLQVELKTTPDTPDAAGLQKAADFVHAFILGELLAAWPDACLQHIANEVWVLVLTCMTCCLRPPRCQLPHVHGA